MHLSAPKTPDDSYSNLWQKEKKRTMRNSNTLELRKSTISKKIGWGFMLLLAILLFVLASRYLTWHPNVYFPEQRDVYMDNTVFLLMHIIGSMLAILIGPFQFLRNIRTGRYLNLHRWLGRVYLLSVLFGGLGRLIHEPLPMVDLLLVWAS